jgi:U3 small nucleolar RNA-associated protein 19
MVIPFVYNLMKRHPALMVMIHRSPDGDGLNDGFQADEPNPNTTGAIDSSLWELVSQQHHYHSTVATMARIFEEQFTKPQYDLEDFLDHTYSTVSSCLTSVRASDVNVSKLFSGEISRKVKVEPSLTTELRHGVFLDNKDSGNRLDSDLVSELWGV